jgi:SM-20-related protein
MFVMNRYCYLSLSDYEFHLAHYPTGTFYKRHLDQFVGRNNRMISVVIYLNEHWKVGDGGELQIYLESGDVTVQPKARRCVLFKSADVEHEVLTTNVGRDSLTGWLLYKPAGLGLLA